MASLQFLSLIPYSKTLTILPQSIPPNFSQNPNPKSFSIPNSINHFDPTLKSKFVTKVSIFPDLLSCIDEELEHNFYPEFKLFVGNLPFHVDNATLARLFQQSGNVEMVEVVYDKLNRKSRGFAFVTMSSNNDAEAAAKMFDGYELDGRQLRVNYGPPPRKKTFIKESKDDEKTSENNTNINNNTVYVGNLSWSVGNQALESLFWEHGNVMQAKVFYDKNSGKSRGFGFVTYSSPNEVFRAVDSLDGVDLDGRNIRVSVAVPLPRR